VNIHEAKTRLSQLLARVEEGEEFVIARSGKPIARVTRIEHETQPKRRLGFMKGAFTVPDDFDTMMQDEIEALFLGDK
jgi:prevent-host-death family protein